MFGCSNLKYLEVKVWEQGCHWEMRTKHARKKKWDGKGDTVGYRFFPRNGILYRHV